MKPIIVVLMAIIFSVCVNSYSNQMAEDGPEVREDAPDFTLMGLDGNEVTLSNFQNAAPVVLIFGSCT